jgi:LuxR family maltose regulon positive regulatory protein
MGMAVTLPLVAGSVLLPAYAGTSTLVTASAGIGVVAATFGLAAGLVAVLLACSAAVVLEMAPAGELNVERPRDAVSLTLFAANGLVVAAIGSLLHGHRSRRASPVASEDAPRRRTTAIDQARPVMLSETCAPLSLRREPLTDRETEVLALLATGMSNAEIGAELFISVNTVKSHLKNVYSKLGVSNRTRALSTALELGVIPDDHAARRPPAGQVVLAGEDDLAA